VTPLACVVCAWRCDRLIRLRERCFIVDYAACMATGSDLMKTLKIIAREITAHVSVSSLASHI